MPGNEDQAYFRWNAKNESRSREKKKKKKKKKSEQMKKTARKMEIS